MSGSQNHIKVPGRGWAYTGAIVGGASSIAANVAHSFVPPAGAPSGWHPQYGAVAVSMAWPLFLFVAVEILIRVQWPQGLGSHLLRWCGLLPVAFVAGFVSYRHMSGLLAHYGEEHVVAVLGPLAVDGMMIMAAGALYVTTTRTRELKAALTASIPALVPAAAPAPVGVPAAPAAQLVPVATAVTPPASSPVAPTPTVVAQRIATSRTTSTPARPAAAPAGTRSTSRDKTSKTTTRPARPAASTIDTPVTASNAPGVKLPVPAALLARVREVATDYQTQHGTPITPGQLAVRLKVTTDQAAQALALLNLPSPPTTVNGQPHKANR
jgi:hypothetical protein